MAATTTTTTTATAAPALTYSAAVSRPADIAEVLWEDPFDPSAAEALAAWVREQADMQGERVTASMGSGRAGGEEEEEENGEQGQEALILGGDTQANKALLKLYASLGLPAALGEKEAAVVCQTLALAMMGTSDLLALSYLAVPFRAGSTLVAKVMRLGGVLLEAGRYADFWRELHVEENADVAAVLLGVRYFEKGVRRAMLAQIARACDSISPAHLAPMLNIPADAPAQALREAVEEAASPAEFTVTYDEDAVRFQRIESSTAAKQQQQQQQQLSDQDQHQATSEEVVAPSLADVFPTGTMPLL